MQKTRKKGDANLHVSFSNNFYFDFQLPAPASAIAATGLKFT